MAPELSSSKLSSTVVLVVDSVVVEPLTVRSPDKVKLVPLTSPVNVAPEREAKPLVPIYVLRSVNATCFIVPASFKII